MSDASELARETEQLEDEALQKRFAALFDDGQGENARRAFVSYCRSRDYHPSQITLLYGQNLFRRLREMITRQDTIISEYRAANNFLLEEAKRLNGGKAVLPPSPENLRRGSIFQKLVRAKFGSGRGSKADACRGLGVKPYQLARMEKGFDVTDGIIAALEDREDWVPAQRPKSNSRRSAVPVHNSRYAEFERRFSHIPKPKKHTKQRSALSPDALEEIGRSWFGAEDWLEPLARFIGYDSETLKMALKGKADHYISLPTEKFILRVQAELAKTGGFVGAVLSPPSSRDRNQQS